MSQVFVSYAKEDSACARMMADALASLGFSVFWDRRIPIGRQWDEVIGRELETAGCVVVLWSRTSVQSRWVREEAERAASRGCLLPVFVDKTDPPLGFGRFEAADLSAWRGDARDPRFADLAAAISETLKAPPEKAVEPPKASPARRRFRGLPLWIGVGVVTLALVVYVASRNAPVGKPPGPANPGVEEVNKAKAFAARGVSRRESGLYPEAIVDLGEAIRLDPSNAEWYNERGRTYSAQGMHDLALEDYNRAIERKPTVHYYYNNRGNARLELGQLDGALKDLNDALRMDPNYVLAYRNRALTYQRLKDWPRAIADWTSAIQLEPQKADWHNNRGYARTESGNPEEALTDLNRAIQLNPRFQIAYENRADAYEKLKDWPRAIADWTCAMKIKETHWQYERRAAARRAIGDEAGAASDTERAAQLAAPSR